MAAIYVHTDHFVFQNLVFSDRLSVTFSFMLFAAEIFDRLVVEETIGMDATSCLVKIPVLELWR